MSRAFVKEDIDVVERTTRRRSSSGLPPGATNYLTEEGANLLRTQVGHLRDGAGSDEELLGRLEDILSTATVVKPNPKPGEAVFGSTITLRKNDGSPLTYRVVGADEVDLHPGGVSWISPLGRALLQAKVGQPLRLEDSTESLGQVISIE